MYCVLSKGYSLGIHHSLSALSFGPLTTISTTAKELSGAEGGNIPRQCFSSQSAASDLYLAMYCVLPKGYSLGIHHSLSALSLGPLTTISTTAKELSGAEGGNGQRECTTNLPLSYVSDSGLSSRLGHMLPLDKK